MAVITGQQSIEHVQLDQPSVQDNLAQTNIDLGSSFVRERKASKIDFVKPQDQLINVDEPGGREMDSPTSLKSIMKNRELEPVNQQVHFEKNHEQFKLDL